MRSGMACVRVLLLTVICRVPGTKMSTGSDPEATRHAGVWYKEQIPDPQVDLWNCGRQGKPSFVCDPDNIIETDQADRIDLVIEDLRRMSECKCLRYAMCPTNYTYGGYQASVLILDTVKTDSDLTNNKKTALADEYINYLRDKAWKYGLCEDDIVILVSRTPRIVRTQTGATVREMLPDYCVDKIYKENRNYFDAENYGEGIVKLLEAYRSVLSGKTSCDASNNYRVYIFVGVFGAILVLGISSLVCRIKLKYPGSQRRQDDMQQQQQQQDNFTDLTATSGDMEGSGVDFHVSEVVDPDAEGGRVFVNQPIGSGNRQLHYIESADDNAEGTKDPNLKNESIG